MPTQPFPIENKSSHHFTSGDVAKLRDYVTARTTDRILRAEISETEVSISTEYGMDSVSLSEIFPWENGDSQWFN